MVVWFLQSPQTERRSEFLICAIWKETTGTMQPMDGTAAWNMWNTNLKPETYVWSRRKESSGTKRYIEAGAGSPIALCLKVQMKKKKTWLIYKIMENEGKFNSDRDIKFLVFVWGMSGRLVNVRRCCCILLVIICRCGWVEIFYFRSDRSKSQLSWIAYTRMPELDAFCCDRSGNCIRIWT